MVICIIFSAASDQHTHSHPVINYILSEKCFQNKIERIADINAAPTSIFPSEHTHDIKSNDRASLKHRKMLNYMYISKILTRMSATQETAGPGLNRLWVSNGLYYSNFKPFVGTHWNYLIETRPLCADNMCLIYEWEFQLYFGMNFDDTNILPIYVIESFSSMKCRRRNCVVIRQGYLSYWLVTLICIVFFLVYVICQSTCEFVSFICAL